MTTNGSLHRNGSSAFRAYSTPETSGPGPAPTGAGSKLLPSLTVALVSTYQGCSSAFRYSSKLAPRRLLTKPAEPASNNGWDNANHDLIVAVGDEFVSTLGTRYVVRDLLGQGTFGQVFKCVAVDDEDESGAIAIKVVKNQAAYYHQARVEIGVLQFLNTRADPGDRHHIVRLRDFFLFRNHLCLAFELLSLNLYELIRHNKFRGLSLSLVRVFISQILDAMVVLRDSRIIHCDLKPENVLLKNVESGEIKLIDFGSACFESRTVYSYIQSRFYRSPEVVLGYPYAMSIDVWSLGCVAAELFLGLPLFPGACEHDLLGRMISTLGPLPDFLLTSGKNARKFFSVQEEVVQDPLTGEQLLRQRFLLRTRQQFEELTGQPAPAGKQYFQHSALADVISAYPFRSGLSDDEVARERVLRESFTDFLLGVLDVNPSTRWTPRQAAQHPFVTGERFLGPFQPAPDLSSSPAVATPVAAAGGRPGSGPGAQQAAAAAAQAKSFMQQQQQHAVHTPGMQIPAASRHSVEQQQAAAALAASPWAAATAHAAAMAAVQARYGSLPQQYSAAHSLQTIMGAALHPGMAQLAGTYGGGGGMQATPSGSYAPLLSPPSRSFRQQLRYADFSSSLLQQQQLASMDSQHGVMPLLQTPTSASQQQQQPFSPGSFQPSSISTYHAALAAAQAALQQQTPGGAFLASSSYQQQHLQQQQQQGHPYAKYGTTPSAVGPGTSWGGAFNPPQQATSLTGFSPGQAAAAAAAAGVVPSSSLSAVPGGAAAVHGLPAGMLQQQLLRSGLQAQAGGGTAGGSRWTSMDGSSPGGTPPLAAMPSGEDVPNPADFDPLWSDALLEEEEQQQQQQRQPDQAPHAKRQHMQAPEQLQGRPPQAPSAHRREPSLSHQLPAAVQRGRQEDMQRLGSQQQQQQRAVLEAASSLGAALGAAAASFGASDPLALAAQCLPQLQQLQQQSQQQQVQHQEGGQLRHGQALDGSGGAFAFRSPFVEQQQQRQAEVASMLSAFGRAAGATSDSQLQTSLSGGDRAQQQAAQQQQLMLLHQALSLGTQHSLHAQHSTTLTDGFANYTLQDAPSTGTAAVVAAAAASAAAALAQQHSGSGSLGLSEVQLQQALLYSQQQQQQQQQVDLQMGTPSKVAQQQQQPQAADTAASMLWSPEVASQLSQGVEGQPRAALLLGAAQAEAHAQLQAQLMQQQQHHHQPLQRQQGFDV